jgi:hypothetical protein
MIDKKYLVLVFILGCVMQENIELSIPSIAVMMGMRLIPGGVCLEIIVMVISRIKLHSYLICRAILHMSTLTTLFLFLIYIYMH